MTKHTNFAITMALSAITLVPMLALAQASNSTDAKPETKVEAKDKKECSGAKCDKKGGACHKHRHGGGEAWKKFKSSLSPDQQTKISAIKTEMKSETAPEREQLKSLREQLKANPTAANAGELKEQMKSLHDQLRAKFKTGREKMMAVLTDPQKAELSKLRKQKDEFRKERGGRGGETTKG